MREDNEDKILIRRFLLGELDEGERQRVEELLIVEGGYRENVLTVEGELIEDYLEGSLSEHEERRFAERFLSSPGQRRKVQVLRAMKKYAAVEVASHSPPAAEESPQRQPERHQPPERPRPRAPYVYAVAAALIIAVVLGGLWATRGWRTGTPPTPEEAQRLEVERELAELNRRGPASPVAPALSLALPPVSVRGTEPASRVPLRDGAAVVELRLLPAGDEHPRYRATLRKAGGANAYGIPELRAESTPDGRAVPVRIRTGLLTRGLYQLALEGVTPDGRFEGVGEYTFQALD